MTNEDLAASLDELFTMLAELKDDHEAWKRLMGKHVKRVMDDNRRLIAENQTYLKAFGAIKLGEMGVKTR